MSELSRGLAFGVSAYLLWGLFPLYVPLLQPSAPVEILAHRVVWSLLVVLLILAVRWHWHWIGSVLRDPRRLALLAVAAAAISVNWGLFIFAVHIGQTLQAALGYFINPLVSVALGVLVLHEPLRRAQVVAVALGATAVLVLGFAYGAVPWLALGMAGSFAGYGLLKKFIGLDGREGLTVETAMLLVPALAYVGWLHATGAGTFATVSVGHTLLLMGVGIATALPLVLFGAAAFRIPLTYVGMLQFIAPIMQFLIAWLVFEEELPLSRWVGFAIVWTALVVFVVDLVRQRPRRDPVAIPDPIPSASLAGPNGHPLPPQRPVDPSAGRSPDGCGPPGSTSDCGDAPATGESSRGAGTPGNRP
ncbi:EamA family transporter RarD [Lipingzhangella sp. LS1_29]|uniref:EamA family transporter RarD n=1 Tax=Lipingzhangella rawalii TaxID=2055835 RepID=A0ABU2H8Y5_9ACTN|nr:EamA family transporter RarD [Lipingzhangella rawalii]MDS1271756.1 EamA family transporter RarD [Lipingzhangella rawalii]